MPPVILSATSQNFNGPTSNTRVINLPATVDPGDGLLVIFSGSGNTSDTTYTQSTPTTGWVEVFEIQHDNAGDRRTSIGVYIKVADGSEDGGTMSVVTSTTTEASTAHVYRIQAGTWEPSSAAVEAAGANFPTSNQPNPPNLAPSWGETEMWLAACSWDGFADSITVTGNPTSFTDQINSGSATGASVGLRSVRREVTDTSLDPATFTLSSTDQCIAVTIAIQSPAAPPDGDPENLEATAVSHKQIDLTWDDEVTGEANYRVERSPDGSTGWTNISGALPADTESYSDLGLDPETEYFYRVVAYNGAGETDPSNVDSATTDAHPGFGESDLYLRSYDDKPEALSLRTYENKTEPPGIVPVGDPVVATSSAGSGTPTVAIPAGTTIAVLGVSVYQSTSGHLNGTLTLAGEAPDGSVLAHSVSNINAAGLWYWILPPTGNQTFSFNWTNGTTTEGASFIWRFYKGVDTDDPVRDTGIGQTQNNNTSTGAMDAEPGDMAVAMIGSEDGGDHDVTASGATEVVQNFFNSQVGAFYEQLIETGPTVTITTTHNPGYNGIAGLVLMPFSDEPEPEPEFDNEEASEENIASQVALSTDQRLVVEEASEEDVAADVALSTDQAFTVESAAEVDEAFDVELATDTGMHAEEAAEEDTAFEVEFATDTGMHAEEAVEEDVAFDVVLSTDQVFIVEPAAEVDEASDVEFVLEPAFDVEAAQEEDVAFDVVFDAEQVFAAEEADEVDVAFDVVLSTSAGFVVEPATEVDEAFDVVLAAEPVFNAELATEEDIAEEVDFGAEPVFEVEPAAEENQAFDVRLDTVVALDAEQAIERDVAAEVVFGAEPVFEAEFASEEDTAADVAMGPVVGFDAEPASEEDQAFDVVLVTEPVFTVEPAVEEDAAEEVELIVTGGLTAQPAAEIDQAYDVVLAPEPVFEVEYATEDDVAYDVILTTTEPDVLGDVTCGISEGLLATCSLTGPNGKTAMIGPTVTSGIK